MVEMEPIARKVAEEHRVIVGKGDPIMAFLAMNGELFEGYGQTLNQMLEKESERLTVSFAVATKQLAAQLRSELQHCQEKNLMEINSAHTEAYRQLHSVLQEHINAVGRIREETNQARLFAWLGAGVAILISGFHLAAIALT